MILLDLFSQPSIEMDLSGLPVATVHPGIRQSSKGRKSGIQHFSMVYTCIPSLSEQYSSIDSGCLLSLLCTS